jgi:hypothetical protein
MSKDTNIADKSKDERMRKASILICPSDNVLDLGGGKGDIQKYLKNKDYTILDCEKNRKDVIYADFNKDIYPDLPYQPNYVMVALRTIEYLEDIPKFFQRIKKYGNMLIFSYYQKPEKVKLWRNKYTFVDIIEFINQSGWKLRYLRPLSNTTEILFVIVL